MADNTVLNAGSGGDVIATDDIAGVKHQRVKVEHGDDGSATDASATNPLPVGLGLVAPKASHATVAALAAGGSSDLDSDQIAVGKTGKLVAVVLASSVALKGILQTVLNAAASADKLTVFSKAGEAAVMVMPSREFFTQAQDAGAGFDGFRLRVTNLDPSQAADAYATFFFDEV